MRRRRRRLRLKAFLASSRSMRSQRPIRPINPCIGLSLAWVPPPFFAEGERGLRRTAALAKRSLRVCRLHLPASARVAESHLMPFATTASILRFAAIMSAEGKPHQSGHKSTLLSAANHVGKRGKRCVLLRDGGMTGRLKTLPTLLSSRPFVLVVSSVGLQGAAEVTSLEAQSEQIILRQGDVLLRSTT